MLEMMLITAGNDPDWESLDIDKAVSFLKGRKFNICSIRLELSSNSKEVDLDGDLSDTEDVFGDELDVVDIEFTNDGKFNAERIFSYDEFPEFDNAEDAIHAACRSLARARNV